MDKKKLVITISRQYGSGGRTVGKKLAQRLGIPFYDEEILRMTSEKSAVGEQYFRMADEKAGINIIKKLAGGLTDVTGQKPKLSGNVTSAENLFLFQSELIRELAERESCIIVGRCADYVLEKAGFKDLLRIFVYSDEKTLVDRAMKKDSIPEKNAMEKVRTISKQRRDYRKYFTGQDWENMDLYDLMLNTSGMDLELAADILEDYIGRMTKA